VGKISGVEVSVLTYNVHGLPGWMAGDEPERRLPRVLAKAVGFQVVLLQEDFAYRDLVAAERRQPEIFHGSGPAHPWPLFQGSGLTVLASLPAIGVPLRAAYGVCHGWLDAANDCFGNKGFLRVRLVLPNGTALDVWDTHLDAGPGPGDQAARTAQLERLAAAVERHSRDRAVLVGGDFNLDWDSPAERSLLERFAARLGLDFGARTPEGAWHSRLDYLLVRSGEQTDVEVLDAGMARGYVDDTGAPLSDHPPIEARLRIAPARPGPAAPPARRAPNAAP
jgi:endonuclease/exonuclease/phosphatase family metal-dependent hydrolase